MPDLNAHLQVLHGAVGAVAAIGSFGSYEFMKKVNGDANILVAQVQPGRGWGRGAIVLGLFSSI